MNFGAFCTPNSTLLSSDWCVKHFRKNVGILSGGNPPTPLPNYLFYRPLLIWTNVSNVSESQNVSVSSRLGNHDVSSRSRLGQNSQCLGLVSVSDTWVSCLVSVSALKVSWTSLIGLSCSLQAQLTCSRQTDDRRQTAV